MALRVPIVLTKAELKRLEDLAQHHPFNDVRTRCRGILSLNAGRKPEAIGSILGVSVQ